MPLNNEQKAEINELINQKTATRLEDLQKQIAQLKTEINELVGQEFNSRLEDLKQQVPQIAQKEEERKHKAQLAEYNSLRKEVENYTQELRTLQRNVVIGVAVVWAWLASYHEGRLDPPHYHVAWSIPFFLVLLGGLRSLIIYTHLHTLGEYVKNEVQPKLHIAWEGCKERTKGPPYALTILMWIVLFVGTVVLWAWHGTAPSLLQQ